MALNDLWFYGLCPNMQVKHAEVAVDIKRTLTVLSDWKDACFLVYLRPVGPGGEGKVRANNGGSL